MARVRSKPEHDLPVAQLHHTGLFGSDAAIFHIDCCLARIPCFPFIVRVINS